MHSVSKSGRALFIGTAISATLFSSAAFAVPYQLYKLVPNAPGQGVLGATPRLNDAARVGFGSLFGSIEYFDGTTSTTMSSGESGILGMNNADLMVGYASNGGYKPVIATPTAINYLSLAGVATAINNAGLAVGYYGTPGTPGSDSFLYNTATSSLTTFNVSPISGGKTGAFSVSSTGVVVGTTNVATGSAAFTYNPATSSTFILPNPSGVGATAGKGVTANGTVIGVSSAGSVSGVNLEQGTPYIYSASGTFTSLPVPAGWNAATIEGVNSQGDFVGALVNGGTRVGYVNKGGVYTVLNGANIQSGGPVYTAYDINDAGYISVTSAFATSAKVSILAPVQPNLVKGDFNFDGVFDVGDIDGFVSAITEADPFTQFIADKQAAFQALYAGFTLDVTTIEQFGDFNGDSILDVGDIDGFVGGLGSNRAGISVVPEPTSLAMVGVSTLGLMSRRRNR